MNMVVVEVAEPYSVETLQRFGIASQTVEEYAFCLGWQHGATWYVSQAMPVTEDQLLHYRNGWALGAWNRIQWLRHGIRIEY